MEYIERVEEIYDRVGQTSLPVGLQSRQTCLLYTVVDFLHPLNVLHLNPGDLLSDDLLPEIRLLANHLCNLDLRHHDADLFLQELRDLHLTLHNLCLDARNGLLPKLDSRARDLRDALDDLHLWDLHWPLFLNDRWNLHNLFNRLDEDLGDLFLHGLV